jgi:hypothetical protein
MPHYSVSYTRELTRMFISNQKPASNTANGTLSDKAQSRIKSAANWLQYLSQMEKKKLVFITLTLSQKQHHPDNFIVVHMLQPMLKWLQRQYGCELYIWKAEVQPDRYYKRNERCIHFHITTNRYVPYNRLRNKWNQLQRAHGYYNDANTNPSTEIRAVKNQKGFALYMAKYLSKKEEDDALKLNCKVWGCSRTLSRMNVTLGEDITTDFHEVMNQFTLQTSKGFKKMKYATVDYTSLSNKKKVPSEILSAVADARDKAKEKNNRRKNYTSAENIFTAQSTGGLKDISQLKDGNQHHMNTCSDDKQKRCASPAVTLSLFQEQPAQISYTPSGSDTLHGSNQPRATKRKK